MSIWINNRLLFILTFCHISCDERYFHIFLGFTEFAIYSLVNHNQNVLFVASLILPGVGGIHSRHNEMQANCLANCNSVQIAAVLTVAILIAIGIGVGIHVLLQNVSDPMHDRSTHEIFFGNEYEGETSKYTYWWWAWNQIAANNVHFQYRIWAWGISLSIVNNGVQRMWCELVQRLDYHWNIQFHMFSSHMSAFNRDHAIICTIVQ